MEEENLSRIEISVRALVEFILRSGDLDNRIAGGDMKSMSEGSKLHRKLQKEAGGDYRAEVTLKTQLPISYDGQSFLLCLEGRADGIYTDACEPPVNEITRTCIDLTEMPVEPTPFIDEIKTTLRPVEHVHEPVAVHRSQAMCYAYMYARDNGLERIGIRMTYCNQENEYVRFFREIFTYVELEEWFGHMTKEYAKWAAWEVRWHERRNESIRSAKFPFEYRTGQRELVGGVYRTIDRSARLFIEAPTGVGKTMSTVFPAVWSMGEGKCEKLFYGTAKTIARTVAEEAFTILTKRGMAFKFVTITSKEKVCVLEKPDCNPDACERARGHFDRVNDAVYDLLTHEERIDREKIEEYAEKHSVCPFEMCLDVSTWVDAVICDYNYLFDPTVHLKRFFENEGKHSYCLLIDEAHNLVERAREMYSAELVKEKFLEAKAALKGTGTRNRGKIQTPGQLSLTGLNDSAGQAGAATQVSLTGAGKESAGFSGDGESGSAVRFGAGTPKGKLAAALDACNKALLAYKKECDEFEIWDECGSIQLALMRFCGVYEDVGRELSGEENEALLELYFDARHFLSMSEAAGEDYTIYTDYLPDRSFRLKLQCMQPAAQLGQYLKQSRSAIFFSATLLPIKYYMEQLGGSSEDYAMYAPSPFDTSKRLLMIGTDVSTKYTRRSASEYERIAEYIRIFTEARTGNYMVFFPSYAMMESVYAALRPGAEGADTGETGDDETCEVALGGATIPADMRGGVGGSKAGDDETCDTAASSPGRPQILMQGRSMTEAEKEAFLGSFEENPAVSRIGFCVMGGIFAEGIDLKNDRLIGVAVVGTGLPMVCNERELFRGYFDEKNKAGFEYAYLYNGMNKVCQAAGRVIRTMDDTGAILLLDERFTSRQYRELFPREWSDYRTVNVSTVRRELEKFWSMH